MPMQLAGRKPKDTTSTKLAPEDYVALRREADEHRTCQSALLRDIVRGHLATVNAVGRGKTPELLQEIYQLAQESKMALADGSLSNSERDLLTDHAVGVLTVIRRRA